MASDGVGKMKQKRSHLNSKPYQRRQSFFGRMKDTVSKISYAPSWLTSAMSRVKKTMLYKPEVSYSNADIAVEVEEDMFLSPTQLPNEPVHDGYVSRPQPQRLSLPARVTNNGPRLPLLLSNTQHSTPIPSRPYPNIPEKHALPATAVMQNDYGFDPNDDMCGDEPSRIGQLVESAEKLEPPHLDESRVPKLKTNLRPAFTEPESNTLDEKTTVRESKNTQLRRTWSERHNASLQYQTMMRNRPSFNTSLFGSPLNNTNTLSESFHESSFYPGKTTFGGSSTSQKKRLNSTTPYQASLPIRKQMKAKPLKSSYDTVTSSTARKILETLERMSTPLSDARKIPANESNLSDSVLSFTPSSYRRPPCSNSSAMSSRRSSLEAPIRGPPTSQRSIVGHASIAKNRQTFLPHHSSSLSRDVVEPRDDNMEPARVPPQTSHIISIGSATNSVTPTLLRSETVTIKDLVNVQSGGKMKKEKSYHKSSKQTVEEEIEVPDLRTDFTLPVNCMPAFNFQDPLSKTTQHSTTEKSLFTPPAAASNKLTPTTVKNADTTCSKFKFSTPISTGNPSPSAYPQKVEFKFSSPIDASDKPNTGNITTGFQQKSSSVKSGFQFGTADSEFSQAGNVSHASASTSSSTPVASPSIGGFKAASTLKTGSVMDILGYSNTTKTLESVVTQKGGSVFDRLGSPNKVPSTSSVKPVPQLKEGSVMDILGKGGSPSEKNNNKLPGPFQQSHLLSTSGSWDCETCMAQNKSESTKCVCCQALKPTSKTPDVHQKNMSKSDDLMTKFMKPPGTWECDACMVQNKTDATSCIACQTAKTNAASGMKKTPVSNSLSSVSKPTNAWQCDTCLVQNKPAATKCIACETAKPVSSNAKSVVDWECDTCLVQNKATATKCIACETAKPGASNSKPAVDWECDTCLVQNKAIATKCIACETPRTGSKPLGGLKTGLTFNSAPSSGFKLPATNSASTSNMSTGGFKLPTSDTTPPVAGGFKFGNEQSSGSSNSNSTGNAGFSFGQKIEDVKIKSENGQVNGTESKPVTGGFSLTQFNSSTPSVKVEKIPENAVSGGFKFGDKGNTLSSSDQGFAFGNNKSTNVNSSAKISTDNVKGGFTFGTSVSATVDTKQSNATLGQNVSFVGKSISSNSQNTSLPVQPVLLQPSSGGISLGRPVNAPTSEPAKLSQEETKPKTEPNKSGFGGFSFGAASQQPKLEPAKEAFGGFNFVKPENKTASPSTFGNSPSIPAISSDQKSGFPAFQPNAAENVLKRNREEKDAEPTGAKKFSFGSSGNAPQANLFVFGQTTSAAPTANTSGFSFSAAGSNSSKPPALPAFGSFGGPTQPDKKPTLANSPFSFNASTPTPTTSAATTLSNAPAFGTATTPISFGKPVSISISSSFGASASSGAAAFTGFGSTESSQKPATGVGFAGTSSSAFGTSNLTASSSFGTGNLTASSSFGTSNTTGTAAASAFDKSGFNFSSANAAPAQSFGIPTTTTGAAGGFNAAPSFNFPASAATPSASIFQFGGKQEGGPSTSNAGFNFGGQNPGPSAPPAFNAAPSFNFNAAAPANFSFSANPTSNEAASGGRKIKKAVRKIRK